MEAVAIAAAVATVAGGVGKAAGDSAGLDYKSSQAARAAETGRVAAAQTDAQLRENLESTLGHIKAVRASSGTDPNSPTGDALLEGQKAISDRERQIRVANLEGQAADDERSSRFYKKSASSAMLWGTVGAFGSGLGRLAAPSGKA